MVQVNRGFGNFRSLTTYYRTKADGRSIEGYANAMVYNIRYGYRILPFLSIGPDLFYANENHELTVVEDSKNKIVDSEISRIKVGVNTRFQGNWIKVFKPYADIGLGYFYMRQTNTPQDPVNTDLDSNNNYNKFDFCVGAGMSFMFWKNHFNIDLGAKYSPIYWSNIFSKKVVFTWKIGYNFDAKKK